MRQDVDSSRAEIQRVKQELQAANRHREVLRDALESKEMQLKSQYDATIIATGSDIPSFSSFMSQSDLELYIDSLNKRINRLQVKIHGVENILSVYRRGIMGLYPDGSTYGAAQYGGVIKIMSTGGASDVTVLVNVHWIDKEIRDIKNAYEDEMKLYDAEISDLRSKLRQSHSYTSELRRKFEENVKSIYRANKSQSSEEVLQHVNFLNVSLEQSHAEMEALQQAWNNERLEHSKRHAVLIEDIARSLQVRDVALQVLYQIDNHCTSHGVNTSQLRKVGASLLSLFQLKEFVFQSNYILCVLGFGKWAT